MMPEFATVILTIPQEDGFIYSVPDGLKGRLYPGQQVSVPFKSRYVSGIIIGLNYKKPSYLNAKDVKAIRELIYPKPVVSAELMKLIQWIADYYVCHLGEAYRLIQSSLNVHHSQMMIRRLCENIPHNVSPSKKSLLDVIPADRNISFSNLKKKVKLNSIRELLAQMEREELIVTHYTDIRRKSILKNKIYYQLIPEKGLSKEAYHHYKRILEGGVNKRRELLEFLQERESISRSELKQNGFSTQVANQLVNSNILKKEEKHIQRIFKSSYNEHIPKITLNQEQQQFIQNVRSYLDQHQFKTFLLHGITGSGKTQIYIELIRGVLEEGKGAIVLIPEIVLTPQTLARFQYNFGERVGVLHSRLSAGEKREVFHRIRENQFRVVIGPRSAVFAPIENLGLIVVDEEHESSYKQSGQQPRYHARDVAIYRAQLTNSVVVLGSATPSFESLYNAKSEHYAYFNLMKRVDKRVLPRISIVDLREVWKKGGTHPVISENLELKIETRLLTKEQIMILQNRRGYSPYLLCKDCGFVLRCPHCDITLTYHQKTRKMLCHYCDYTEVAPDVCPECQGMDILYKGIGTQQLEEVLMEKFPHSRTVRMDQDTTRGKHDHLTLLEKFRSGAADMLLGTKMIAKGLDFRRVSLVGIVSADQGLNFPDFRANEKVFQLLTQAAGRAGRGENSGEVVIQSLDPAHFIYKYLLTHDYLAFYKKEMENRQSLSYPPYSRLMLIRIEGDRVKYVQQYGESIVKFLWKANQEKRFAILGPAPAPISRIQNVYRYHILVKQDKKTDPTMSVVRKLVKNGLLKNPDLRKWPVKIIIDMDPIEIL